MVYVQNLQWVQFAYRSPILINACKVHVIGKSKSYKMVTAKIAHSVNYQIYQTQNVLNKVVIWHVFLMRVIGKHKFLKTKTVCHALNVRSQISLEHHATKITSMTNVWVIRVT